MHSEAEEKINNRPANTTPTNSFFPEHERYEGPSLTQHSIHTEYPTPIQPRSAMAYITTCLPHKSNPLFYLARTLSSPHELQPTTSTTPRSELKSHLGYRMDGVFWNSAGNNFRHQTEAPSPNGRAEHC